jgi:protoheme IX farnesyltransferase
MQNETAEAVVSTAVQQPTWRSYYDLTKPGITKMVVLTATAGYYLGIPGSFLEHFSSLGNVLNFAAAVIGTALVSAGSCALNNWMEKGYDSLMKRTQRRPLPSGKLTSTQAAFFGFVLIGLGVIALLTVNALTTALAVITVLSYNAVYTPLKRKTTLATLVGGIPGALPPVGGWVAVRGSIDFEAAVLFLILFFWQIPHFLSLSWMYRKDYQDGGFKMLSVIDPTGAMVARQAVVYTAILLPTAAMLHFKEIAGSIFLFGSLLLGSVFLFFALRMLVRGATNTSARQLLLSSYLYLVGIITLIFIDKQLP